MPFRSSVLAYALNKCLILELLMDYLFCISECYQTSLLILCTCHCFIQNYIKAMRLFTGEPVWTPHNRPADNMEARKNYVAQQAKGFAVK